MKDENRANRRNLHSETRVDTELCMEVVAIDTIAAPTEKSDVPLHFTDYGTESGKPSRYSSHSSMKCSSDRVWNSLGCSGELVNVIQPVKAY